MNTKYPSTPPGVYVYKLLYDGIPFYIGYGVSDRAHFHEKYARGETDLGYGLTEDYNKFKTRKIQKIINIGKTVEYEFISCGDVDEAKKLEIELIKKFGRRGIEDDGVLTNRTPGGDGGYTWAHKREEHIAKLKKIWADKSSSEKREVGRKVRETRTKNGNWAKPWTESERKRRIPGLQKQAIKQRKVVLQYDKQLNFIKEWESTKKASDTLSISQGAISATALEYQGSAGGYKWKYKD